ncbi:MAG: pyridoxamine 5'-phosphate oxidase [Acidimicrobiia bacterium]
MPIAPPDEHTVNPDPMVQFADWYSEAVVATGDRAAAMTVATATPAGRPSARVVLLRGFDARGFVFYTNYESRKAEEIAGNDAVAAVIYWPELDAQVRIEGDIARVAAEESEAYFAHRPRGHQIGAWASHQSAPIADRATLERQVDEAEARFPDVVPLPPYWGGYRISPAVIEFWKAGPDRVHDRVQYRRDGGSWSLRRLSP